MRAKTANVDKVEPRKVPVQNRSRVRFERILEVALTLIIQKGVDTIPMSEIAGAAEISVASLYQYFPDKAAIVATLADRFNQEGQQCVKSCFSEVETTEQLITAFHETVDGYYEFFSTVPGSYAIWQATQSDRRLQQIDIQDVELHVVTVAECLKTVFPGFTESDARLRARLFLEIVAVTVRSASAEEPEFAKQMVELCKTSILTPSLRHMIAAYDLRPS